MILSTTEFGFIVFGLAAIAIHMIIERRRVNEAIENAMNRDRARNEYIAGRIENALRSFPPGLASAIVISWDGDLNDVPFNDILVGVFGGDVAILLPMIASPHLNHVIIESELWSCT